MLVVRGAEFEKARQIPPFNPDVDSEEWGVFLNLCEKIYKQNPTRWTETAKAIVGVSEETTTGVHRDRKSTRLNSSHVRISYAVFCLKKKKKTNMHIISD